MKVITLITKQQVVDAGKIKPNTLIEKQFTITNSGKTPIELEDPRIPCECNTAKIEKKYLEPGESTTVNMTLDSKQLEGQVVKSVYIKVKGQEGELRLILTTEIILE